MSPYLFILVMEMAAIYLNGQIMKGAIRLPYSVSAIPDVHCLMFADDLLLFSIASVKSITNIKRVLSQLEERIGFIINNSKSFLFTFNVDTPHEKMLANIGGWQAAKLPARLLGCPSLYGKLNGEEYGVIVDQLKLSVAEVRSLGEARLTLPSKALTASTCIQLANETEKLVSNATEFKDLSSTSIWDAIRQKGSQEGWRKRIWNNHIPARASWTTYTASHMRLTTQDRLQRHGLHLANRCHLSKEAFQRLQLKEDERKAMSTWLRTGILCEGRLSSLSMDTNVLQIVTYKKGITTMVMGMWRLRDMESIEAIFTEAQSREDEAELQVLKGWLQSMARVNGSLGIISNNEGWKRRLRAMLEGRMLINQKWHHMRAAIQRLRVLSQLPTLEAGEQMCQYGERDGRDDGG
ncbi:hypothetical protein EJ110_NYTH31765 [Nymphaea thermarum]|nr:hypothetical protein EJ110_NYTH31765 [Nymphaea thermarum]